MHLIRRENDFKNPLSANMVTANKMPQKMKKPVNSSSASVKQKQFWRSGLTVPPVAWAAVRSGAVVLLLLTFCLLLLPL